MKHKVIFIFISCITLGSAYSNDSDIIWGIWNVGTNDEFTISLSTGTYYRAGEFLGFDPNYNSKARILYEGGTYIISNIESKKDEFYLFLECSIWSIEKSGRSIKKTVKGLVAMHFVNKNTMWLELIQGPLTDSDFPIGDFIGERKIFWRAKLVDQPEKG